MFVLGGREVSIFFLIKVQVPRLSVYLFLNIGEERGGERRRKLKGGKPVSVVCLSGFILGLRFVVIAVDTNFIGKAKNSKIVNFF